MALNKKSQLSLFGIMELVLYKRAIDSQPYIQCTLKELDYITIKQTLKRPQFRNMNWLIIQGSFTQMSLFITLDFH